MNIINWWKSRKGTKHEKQEVKKESEYISWNMPEKKPIGDNSNDARLKNYRMKRKIKNQIKANSRKINRKMD